MAIQPTSTLAAAPFADSSPRARALLTAINVRRGPGIAFAVMAYLRGDETAAVLARDRGGDWYAVRTDAGLTGWVAANVVELVAGEAGAIAVAATIPAEPTAETTIEVATAVAPAGTSPADEPAPPRPTRQPTANPEPTNTPFMPPSPTDDPTPNPYP